MKIRGTAAHIAEKYTTLARDALSSGDTVAGENYLQHAEYYNRLIMANQAQQTEGANGSNAARIQGNGPDESDDEKQPEAADNAHSTDEVSADEGLTRTLARTSARRSRNGARAGAGADEGGNDASARAADGDEAGDSPDEAVT